MTPKNIAQHRLDPNIGFWKNLKEGSDYFEAAKEEPKVAVCGKRYVFGTEVSDCNPVVPPAPARLNTSMPLVTPICSITFAASRAVVS